MSIVFNQDLLSDDPAGEADSAPLPDGVYDEQDWAERKTARQLPPGRTELFTVNGRVYTAPSTVDPGVIFRYMKVLRQRGDTETAMADMLYDVLGDAVMDILGQEKLDPDEFRQVMRVVQKHVAGATKQTLGN